MTDNHISALVALLGERIRAARSTKGLKQEDFGALGGVGLTTQQKYEKGLTAPTAEYFYRLRHHGIDIAELLTGDSSPSTFTSHLRASIEESSQREREGLVEVEEIDLIYGMGATFADAPVRVRSHLLSRGLLATITSSAPSDLTIARGTGDSMLPTIQDGDVLLIDRSQRSIREQDAIWALTIGDFAMIKRVRSRGRQIAILSDNERVPAEEVPHEEINVVGRVIFIGRRL